MILLLREDERKRIESENPNPRLPLVRFVGGTWRVGGILALSRAFGDAYMKGSLQFEGIDSGTNYRSGFGVIADPYISVIDLQSKEEPWKGCRLCVSRQLVDTVSPVPLAPSYMHVLLWPGWILHITIMILGESENRPYKVPAVLCSLLKIATTSYKWQESRK